MTMTDLRRFECDRCGKIVLKEEIQTIHYYDGCWIGDAVSDLCNDCWKAFRRFMRENDKKQR